MLKNNINSAGKTKPSINVISISINEIFLPIKRKNMPILNNQAKPNYMLCTGDRKWSYLKSWKAKD